MTKRSGWMALGLATVALTLAHQVSAQSQHVMQTAMEAKWGPAPPMVPPGAQIAVLSGDPSAAGPFAIRLKLPARYAVPAHSHPGDENVLVTTGALFMGMGDKLDKTKGQALPIGGYAFMPANMNHFAYTKQPTVIVIFGQGPVDFKYVDPKDDPRNSPPATK